MLETFLGPTAFGGTSPAVTDSTPHVQKRRLALQVCNFVMGHLPENPVRMEDVHRAQNTYCLRALLLRSLQEPGEWENLVDGIEIGINTTLAPSSPAGSIRPGKVTLDDVLRQVHSIGTSICGGANSDTSSSDGFPADAVEREGFDVIRSLEASRWRVLEPTPLLFPEEVRRFPQMLWPSSHGSLPSIAISTAPGNSGDDVRMERLRALTNAATSRLLRTWATRVRDLLEVQPPTTMNHTLPTVIPSSTFQATQSPAVLANYLALSLSPAAATYNDLGILLSSIDSKPEPSQSSRGSSPSGTTGSNLSRVYFEAGLEAGPDNAHLLTNLGSYWKKERNYEEAIRFVSQPLRISCLTSRAPPTGVAFNAVSGTINWLWPRTRNLLPLGSILDGL